MGFFLNVAVQENERPSHKDLLESGATRSFWKARGTRRSASVCYITLCSAYDNTRHPLGAERAQSFQGTSKKTQFLAKIEENETGKHEFGNVAYALYKTSQIPREVGEASH